VYVTKTAAERTANTVKFFLDNFNMPETSFADATRNAATELIHALHHPSPASPFATIGDSQLSALAQLADIFHAVPENPSVSPSPLQHPPPVPRVAPANTQKPTLAPAISPPTVNSIPTNPMPTPPRLSTDISDPVVLGSLLTLGDNGTLTG
jgi:hypothetical protein